MAVKQNAGFMFMASAIGNDVKIGNLDMKIYDIHVRWDQCLKLS